EKIRVRLPAGTLQKNGAAPGQIPAITSSSGAGATSSEVAIGHSRSRRFDHWFFSCLAVIILISVFVGFARTYYLAGVLKARLPSFLIHMHGAVFSCWILLFITQTGLVAVRRVNWHRRLGFLGL